MAATLYFKLGDECQIHQEKKIIGGTATAKVTSPTDINKQCKITSVGGVSGTYCNIEEYHDKTSLEIIVKCDTFGITDRQTVRLTYKNQLEQVAFGELSFDPKQTGSETPCNWKAHVDNNGQPEVTPENSMPTLRGYINTEWSNNSNTVSVNIVFTAMTEGLTVTGGGCHASCQLTGGGDTYNVQNPTCTYDGKNVTDMVNWTFIGQDTFNPKVTSGRDETTYFATITTYNPGGSGRLNCQKLN